MPALYEGDFGATLRALRDFGAVAYPVQPADAPLLAELAHGFRASPDDGRLANRILAGMCFGEARALLPCAALPAVPVWLLDDCLAWVAGDPSLFFAPGDVARHAEHLSDWVDALHARCREGPDVHGWRRLAWRFLVRAHFIPLYFSRRNVRETYRKRSELIDMIRGVRLDHTFGPRREHGGRIRFGVLARNIWANSEGSATLPVFSRLDRERVEVIVLRFPRGEAPGSRVALWTRRADRVVELTTDPGAATDAIRALDLDVLWFANNLTAVSASFELLCAHRLARVQMTGGCSPLTTGLRHVDFYVSGSLTEPERGAQEHYTERLLCMEGPALCFDQGDDAQGDGEADALDRTRLGIPDDAVVYASGANFFKITPELEETWLRILAAVPGACLLLYPYGPWAEDYPRAPFFFRMFATCGRLGVDPRRIVVINPWLSLGRLRALLRAVADVYLDSFPYSGSTSLLDPLHAGVPPLVVEGGTMRGRMGAGMLRDLGLPGLIAADEEGYIRLATRLGRDAVLRRDWAARVRDGMARGPRFLDPAWCGREMMRILAMATGVGPGAQENPCG